MTMLALLTIVLAATPAAAETYLCLAQGGKTGWVALDIDVQAQRMAIDFRGKVIELCGPNMPRARCKLIPTGEFITSGNGHEHFAFLPATSELISRAADPADQVVFKCTPNQSVRERFGRK